MKVVSKLSRTPVVAAAILALTLPLGAATTAPSTSVLLRLTSKTSGGPHAELSQGRTTAHFLRPMTACSQLASLSYDFSKVKISKNLDFFKKNSNFVSLGIWQLVFDL